jgi:hypothetical protein
MRQGEDMAVLLDSVRSLLLPESTGLTGTVTAPASTLAPTPPHAVGPRSSRGTGLGATQDRGSAASPEGVRILAALVKCSTRGAWLHSYTDSVRGGKCLCCCVPLRSTSADSGRACPCELWQRRACVAGLHVWCGRVRRQHRAPLPSPPLPSIGCCCAGGAPSSPLHHRCYRDRDRSKCFTGPSA